MPRAPIPLSERLMAKVDRTDDCWLWTGARTKAGYGLIGLGGRSDGVGYVHRLVYEMRVGPIPAGLELDHLCRVRHCCNPAHLEAVTRKTNVARGLRGAGKPRPPYRKRVAA